MPSAPRRRAAGDEIFLASRDQSRQYAALADLGRHRSKTDWKKHSCKTAQDGEPAKSRDQHRPAA
jgi:hypothetical protein